MTPAAAPTGSRDTAGDEATITPRSATVIPAGKDSIEQPAPHGTLIWPSMETGEKREYGRQFMSSRGRLPYLMSLSGRHMPSQMT